MVKVYNLCRVKTNRLAVLTIKSGLDPHMINKLKDGYKSHSGYFLWPCWVPTISVLTLAYCCSEGESCGEVFWRCCWDLGVRNPQLIACEVWSLRFQDKLYNSDNLLIVVFTWYCYWLFNYNVSICMKLDHVIHIVMHSVFLLKPGVTVLEAITFTVPLFYFLRAIKKVW